MTIRMFYKQLDVIILILKNMQRIQMDLNFTQVGLFEEKLKK